MVVVAMRMEAMLDSWTVELVTPSATADHAAPCSSTHRAAAPAPPDHPSTCEATSAACASSPATSATPFGKGDRNR